jgi:hypothetical protein
MRADRHDPYNSTSAPRIPVSFFGPRSPCVRGTLCPICRADVALPLLRFTDASFLTFGTTIIGRCCLINDQEKRKKMSEPRFTENSRRDLNHKSALNGPSQSKTGGIVAAVIAALLIVGGIYYWSNRDSLHVASTNAPGGIESTTRAPTTSIAPSNPAPVAPPSRP